MMEDESNWRLLYEQALEPILKDGEAKKNGCERHAAKRFLPHVHREHPHWNELRKLFLACLVPDWKTPYKVVAFDHRHTLEVYDSTS